VNKRRFPKVFAGLCLEQNLEGRTNESNCFNTIYGPPEVLQLKDVEKPTPKDHQVLVKVHAASINALDWRRFEKQSLLGRFMDEVVIKAGNNVLGTDVAGRVEAVGSSVTEFKVGDEVFGVCPGSFAEYACNGESKFALKPANVSFEVAAAVPVAAFTALQGLRDKGQIQPGQKVLIDGASGGVGVYALQIAKSFGAEVTAVCSTRTWIWRAPLGQIMSLITRKKI
jgi:NADPH:quinone reductase-like Zn-dependent oxidoreductase